MSKRIMHKKIIIMANNRHKSPDLPPQSPDLMPIEMVSFFKYFF